jgi:hypothetical protein
MRIGASFRVGRGMYMHMGGGGAVAMLLSFALLGGLIRMVLVILFAIIIVIAFFGAYFMSEARLKSLLTKSIDPSSVKPDGQYTNPKTWGVYQVERLLDGRRGKGFHFGNHPIRQQELIRQFGEAQTIGIFEKRIDAEEVAYLMNGSRRTAQ